jgi:polyisoprenoid-binding protein YceI
MKNKFMVFGVVAVLALGALAAGVYNWVLGPTLAPSGELTAIPVLPVESTATPKAASPAGVTPSAPTEVAAPATQAPTAAADTGTELQVLQIVPSESEVRFVLSEVLRGQPTTVVGLTNQVAGQIAVDPRDLSTARVGVIQVNARELATDNNQRNRAIRNFILNTDQYEFISFAPTSVIGLDGSAQPGDTFTFQLAGDLTIRDVTQPVVFDVTATVEAMDRLSGSAIVTLRRGDYALTIPRVPSVADVSEEVRVELDFVAAGS